MNLSPDGKLPPRSEWHTLVKNPDGSIKLDVEDYPIKRELKKESPIMMDLRYPFLSWAGVNYDDDPKAAKHPTANVDVMEAGPGEILASTGLHLGFATGDQMRKFLMGQYTSGTPINGVQQVPFGVPGQKDSWLTRTREYLYNDHPWNN